VILGDDWPDRILPEGWADLPPRLIMNDAFGARLGEFCPDHAAKSIIELLAAFPALERARP